jgi:sugar transferase (PEP-CTERM/EpsH1 system associated)
MSAARDLLFLAHRVPYPPDKGDKIRAYHLLRHLSKHFRVHLGCFADEPEDLRHAQILSELCASTIILPLNRTKAMARGLVGLAFGSSLSEGYFGDSRMTRWVAATVSRVKPESIFVYCSAMAPYAMPYAHEHRVLLDMVDVDSEKWHAYSKNAAWPVSPLYARESRALLHLERRAATTFDRSFFVSRAEADAFLAHAPEAAERVGYFQNGVDLDYFKPGRDFSNPFANGCRAIVFVGRMDYRPNVEAVEWFARDILPGIRRHHPGAQFWIVGANPAPRVAALGSNSSVHVTGRVADVRPYLAHAACVVAPLHIARGVQNKMLEAMAMARPVVATPQACEGLSARAGEDVLVAQTAAEFVEAVGVVLTGAADGLGGAARARVEADYDWTRNLAVLDHLFVDAREAQTDGTVSSYPLEPATANHMRVAS